MRNRSDLSGRIVGSWTVLAKSDSRGKHGQVYWDCQCRCGAKKLVMGESLRRETSTQCLSCKNTIHGMEKTPTYSTWVAMKRRCMNQKDRSYADYGGRGITVCDEWQSFEGFFADMGEKPEGTSIDRIDVQKGYFKDNCRWATPTQQMRNRRDTKKYEYLGEINALGYFADKANIPVRRVQQRLNAGWDLKSALTISVRAKQK